MKEPFGSAEDWLPIVRGEFLEMPGLQLTHAQAQKLWTIDARVCTAVLNTLVEEHFLRVTSDGRYARATTTTSDVRR